eukprot:CAMPEP_0178370550 /NCGR_PEP_ID=MMETSP0689_2-20121128/363_1 /TAXON_ID=160604 /ORGANISM="Amphidinium massartii, Strain CS-259" /LENGTH=60 /DNA_ID=CAMNT_0019990381 /DNA_START=488 /DNA_END=670 /DNA_ORIENTATION=+
MAGRGACHQHTIPAQLQKKAAARNLRWDLTPRSTLAGPPMGAAWQTLSVRPKPARQNQQT